MNYACLITGAISIFAAFWWLVRGGGYVGPQAMAHEDGHGSAPVAVGMVESEVKAQ